MTVSLNRVYPDKPTVRVQFTYGPISASVDENFHHLRHVWSQLGSLLDEMETEEKTDG